MRINKLINDVLLNTINITFMKHIISISLITLLFFSTQLASGNMLDSSLSQSETTSETTLPTASTVISPDMIQVHPQPLSVGDATVKISSKEKIISTSIYTITGERMAHQVHNDVQKVQKNIPYDLPRGEYLLKLETEGGVGLKRILVR